MKSGRPIGKIARRLGVTHTFKCAKIVNRRPQAPGVHGARRRGAKSVYGKQLIEKQKLRFQFMVSEKALRRAFHKAKSMQGGTGGNLIGLLDQRLDANIFRAGVVRSVPAARQLVSHRHVLVNGKRVHSPSYLVQTGDVISFSEKAKEFAFLNEGFMSANPPKYIAVDGQAKTLRREDAPERELIPVDCNEQMVVEWYSR